MKLSKILALALAMVLIAMVGVQAEVLKMEGAELQKIQNDNKAKDGVLVVDVRSAEEYQAGHLKHAVNVPLDKISENPEYLAYYKEIPVILYCNSGKKSGQAAQILADNGYKTVYNAQGVKEFEYQLYKHNNVSVVQFLEMIQSGEYTLVDARPAKDYEEGHMEGAVSVPFDAVEANAEKVEKDKPAFIYCFTGNKSSETAQKLAEMGFDVYNILEGTKEYGYTLVK